MTLTREEPTFVVSHARACKKGANGYGELVSYLQRENGGVIF